MDRYLEGRLSSSVARPALPSYGVVGPTDLAMGRCNTTGTIYAVDSRSALNHATTDASTTDAIEFQFVLNHATTDASTTDAIESRFVRNHASTRDSHNFRADSSPA